MRAAKEVESIGLWERGELKDDILVFGLVCWSMTVFFKVENPGGGLGRNSALVYEYVHF